MAANELERQDERLPPGLDQSHADTAPAADLAGILQHISTLFADADRRQGDALRDLQRRIESLSRKADTFRDQVPEEYAPAFGRIEDGLGQIANRLSRAEGDRAAMKQSQPTLATNSAAAEGPAGHGMAGEAEQSSEPYFEPHAFKTSPDAATQGHAPAPLMSAVEPAGSLRGSLRPDSIRSRSARDDVDTFDIVDSTNPGNADDPWDNASAEALTQVYESLAEPALPPPETSPTVPHAPPTVPLADVPMAARMDRAAPPAVNSPVQPQEASPVLDFGRDWLEARFAEIAARVEQSLAEFRSDAPVVTLDSRLDQFESRFGQVLQDMAAHTKPDNLSEFEAHLDDLTQHIEQAHLQLQRLDTIEAQLNTVMEKLSDQRLSEILEQSATGHVDVDRIAQAAAEQVAQRLAHVNPASGASEADARRLEELRELLGSFMAERRHGEEQTVGMLDTMQQAMIRLLDRVDALELTGYATHELAQDPGTMQPPPAVAEPHRAFGPLHAVEPPRRNEPHQAPAAEPSASADDTQNGGRTTDVTRDQLIAEARRAMQLAAAKREAEQQEAEAAKTEAKSKGKSDKAKPDKGKAEASQLVGGISKSGRRIMVGAFTLLLLSSAAVMLLMPRKPNLAGAVGTAGQVKATTAPSQAAVKAGANATASPSAPAAAKQDAAAPPPQPADRQEPAAAATAPSGIPKAFLPRSVPETGVDSLSHEPSAAQDRAVIQDAGVVAPFPGITIAPSQGAFAPRAGEPQRLADGSVRIPGIRPDGAARTTTVSAPAGDVAADMEPSAGNRVVPAEMPPLSIGPSSLRQAAAKGDASAEFEVAARFAEGKGVPQNFQQAMKWYQRSASQGFAASQYRLGTLYERGLGAKADPGRARVWYQRAAEQGHVKAMHNLAVMSTAKDLAKPDYATAAQWFKEAAERGLSDSQYNLGVLYESGLGVAKDNQQAYKWYSAARVAGDKEAGRRLDMLRAKVGAAEIALGEALAASFEAKPVDRLVNDAIVAGEAWKSRAAHAPSEPRS